MLGGKKKEEPMGTTAWDDPRSTATGPVPAAAPTATVPAPAEGSTFIARGSEFVGKLTFEGTVRIDGNVQGEIFSKGTLIIGPGAQIKAAINVESCQIMGTVHGNVNARQKLELKKPGRLVGDIRTPTLVLEAGVIFEGNCRMENLVQDQPRAAASPASPAAPPAPSTPKLV
jgi:cytoskeletal protein CcmA (bactofilin family)